MNSIVTLYVSHGDTTDPLTQMIDDAFFVKGAMVLNYELSVDVDTEQADDALQYTERLQLDDEGDRANDSLFDEAFKN